MSILRAPSLGPIVGHTTATSCKLWIRAQDSHAFQVGVVAVLEEAGKPINLIYYFLLDGLNKERNRIGIFNLGEENGLGNGQATESLKPKTEYKVCLATLTINDFSANVKDLSDEDLKPKLPDPKELRNDFNDLGKKSVALFRTFPNSNSVADRLTFLLGSCRYPGSDRIFNLMDQQACKARDADRPCFVLMVGDQIYADQLKWLKRAKKYKEFQQCYLTAFGSRNMRRLLRHTPTYMILDDHEIEDNWSREHLRDDHQQQRLFANAIEAYRNYQWSHGPCTYGNNNFYYKFNVAGYPFFVLDTRTLRTKNKNDITKNEMLGQDQLGELLKWLKKMQKNRKNVPKFIVSSNVFVPNETEERIEGNSDSLLSQSDSWPAFPKTREAILDCIVTKKVQNVVFLSGDIHCSNVAEIELTNSKKNKSLKAFSITSSPFFTPFFDGDPEDYVSDSRVSEEADSFPFGNGWTMNYRSFFPFSTRSSSFCQVEIDKTNKKLIIHLFDHNGDSIVWSDAEDTWNFPKFRFFQMAKW